MTKVEELAKARKEREEALDILRKEGDRAQQLAKQIASLLTEALKENGLLAACQWSRGSPQRLTLSGTKEEKKTLEDFVQFEWHHASIALDLEVDLRTDDDNVSLYCRVGIPKEFIEEWGLLVKCPELEKEVERLETALETAKAQLAKVRGKKE